MSFRNILSKAFAFLCILAGLFLIALSLFPYGMLASFADSIMPDGEFESLTEGNEIVFRVFFAVTGLLFFAPFSIIVCHQWPRVSFFLRTFLADTRRFFCELRPSKKEKLFLAAVLIIMVMAVVYRLEYVNSSLHHDEAYTYMAFAHSLRTAISDYHLPNNHVLHSILVYLSTQPFGNAPWAVRLPAFTAGTLLVPFIYMLGKRFYDRWVGLGAALLVVLSPALIGYATNARGYSLIALFTLITIILGDVVLREKNLFAWGLLSVFSAFGFYTVPVMLFPFSMLYVWLLVENWICTSGIYHSKWDFLRYWLVSGLATAIFTLLLYLPIMIYSGPQKLFANEFVAPAAWQDMLNIFSNRFERTWLEWTNGVPAFLVFLCILGVVLSLIFQKRLSGRKVPLQLTALLWLAVLLVIRRPQAGSKIWVFLLPLALLWAAAGIFGLLGLVKVKSLPLSALAVGLLFAATLGRAAWLLPQLPELWAIHGDEENAVQIVESRLETGEEKDVAPTDDASVWYYAELHGLSAVLYRSESAFDRLFVFVNPDEGQTPASVMDKRGPGQDSVSLCNLLQTFGKIQVFECWESP